MNRPHFLLCAPLLSSVEVPCFRDAHIVILTSQEYRTCLLNRQIYVSLPEVIFWVKIAVSHLETCKLYMYWWLSVFKLESSSSSLACNFICAFPLANIYPVVLIWSSSAERVSTLPCSEIMVYDCYLTKEEQNLQKLRAQREMEIKREGEELVEINRSGPTCIDWEGGLDRRKPEATAAVVAAARWPAEIAGKGRNHWESSEWAVLGRFHPRLTGNILPSRPFPQLPAALILPFPLLFLFHAFLTCWTACSLCAFHLSLSSPIFECGWMRQEPWAPSYTRSTWPDLTWPNPPPVNKAFTSCRWVSSPILTRRNEIW